MRNSLLIIFALLLLLNSNLAAQEDSLHDHHEHMEQDSLGHEHHHEDEHMHGHEEDIEGSDHHHAHGAPEMMEEEKTLLFQETQMDSAYKILEGGGSSEEDIKSYYKETGMYAFDMVPDHWFDPANRKDLRRQSIFLAIGIVLLSLVIKFWNR